MAIHYYPPKTRDARGRFKKKTPGVFRDANGRFVPKTRALKSRVARSEYIKSKHITPKVKRFKVPKGYRDAPLRGPEAVAFRGPQNDPLDLDTDGETPDDLIGEIREDRAEILQQEDKKS